MKKINLITTLFYCLISSLTIAQVAPTPNSPGSGNSLGFDGVDDDITFADQVMPLGAKTISLWVRRNSENLGVLIENNANWTIRHGTSLFLNAAGNFVFNSTRGIASNPRFDLVGNIAVDTNEWTYVAVSWDGTTAVNGVSIYVNGILDVQGTAASTETIAASFNLVMGRTSLSAAGWFFDGEIDEVRLWNRALIQAEIRDNMCHTLMGTEPNLVGYWQMDAMGSTCGGATQVCDMTGNGNNGTLN